MTAMHLAMSTDRRRLLQSVINVLSNAAKFTESGSITIGAVPCWCLWKQKNRRYRTAPIASALPSRTPA